MIEEFWSETVTRKSFEKLTELSKKYKGTVIGGWGIYIWTGAHKSKDIDLIIDYDILLRMRSEYRVEKNEKLRKYEIKMGEFDVDLYLPHYSKLIIPVEKIKKHVQQLKGMRVPSPEVLLILKQGAEIDRRGSMKGRKDLIDILTILIHSPFDVKKYRSLLRKEKLEYLEKELRDEVKIFDEKDLKYLGLNLKEFAAWKKKFLKMLKG